MKKEAFFVKNDNVNLHKDWQIARNKNAYNTI